MSNSYDKNITDLLLSLNKESCPTNVNLHTHTLCSDGSLKPIDLLLQAKDIGLQHLSITDHHSVNAYKEIDSFFLNNNLEKCQFPRLWTGIEISCLLKKCLVHVIGLDFDVDHESMSPYIQNQAPIGNYLQSINVVDSIHNAGGIALLAHPARYRVDFANLIAAAAEIGFDGAEVWYDYDFNEKWSYSKFICDQVLNKIEIYNLLPSCGTDSHGFTLLGR